DSDWSACEPLSINKGTPASTTTIKNAADNSDVSGALPLGSTVYDTNSVTNAGGFPLSGTVTFRFYSTASDCTGPSTDETGVAVGTKSSNHGPLGAGGYSFQAKYVAGSDANHNDSDWSACEPLTIIQAAPSITTTLSDSDGVIRVGDTIHDSATLSGASADAVGTVKYRYYSSLEDC